MNSVILKERIRSNVQLQHLAALYQMMIDNRDHENATKVLELYEKLDKKEMMVSFAGHFSAGKSSMISTLTGAEILPKSPIPTSANIVEISSGEGVARVFFRNQEPVEYKEPYDIDMIKEYSKDKDAIKRMEISTSKPIIPPGCKIMDTPGIDSADDADRLMTEASLHLVDVLFYVMDYNHVQSEVNLRFLKGLQEQEIPFYVIINQVDKHDEAELPFCMFDRSIKQTFDQWNLSPVRVFYSSLFAPSMEQNELPEIKQTLFTILGEEKEAYSSIDHAVKNVIESHKRFLKNQYEEKLSLHDMQEEEVGFNQIEELYMKLDQIDANLLRLKEDFHHELQQTLKNAYLMPSSLRDKAELFLESKQNDFKVGLFNSKKKTELEREERQTDFINSLQETTDTAIEWRLRDKFTALLKTYGEDDPTLQNEIQRLNIEFTAEDVVKLIKPGAKLNGDFVLNYTNDVSADIKNLYKQKARKLWDAIYEVIHKKNKQQRTELENEINYLQQLKDNNRKRAELEAELNDKSAAIDRQLETDTVNESAWKLIEKEQINRQQPLKVVVTDFNHKVPESEKMKENSIVHTKKEASNSYSVENVLKSMETAVATVEELPGFQTMIDDLGRKQERLTHRSYTIALFGAFSAGKSSFANALLGEKVLPVSPNPTTAAINRINPVTEQHKHGTVVVTLKDKETLLHDLLSITKKFSPSGTEFEGLLDWVLVNKIHQNEQLNNLYQSYLRAMINGYNAAKENIGNKIAIDLNTFSEYVTDETKACYIESIDLYYDCSVTRQGITLVDTPGADSVNARHTNASFDYIKYADAILYVTYYNHALSRADKDFLMQLGRVKETFEMDKMFFIINAADLANDDQELQLVKNYAEDQLIQLGVRFPRLYPVSSKRSLQNKLEDQTLNQEMGEFEKAFFHFIHHDLTSLTVDAALWDLQRMFKQTQQYLQSLDMDNKEKEALKRTLSRRKDTLHHTIYGMETDVFEKQMTQKIEKQLFYVIERLSIRFHDMFKEMFNPTTITASGKQAQIQLRMSLQNLIDYVAFELLKELQAVSLRVESEINTLAKEVYFSLAEQCNEIDESFTVPDFEMKKLETPAYQEVFPSADSKSFDKILSTFKGTKAFFEKNEKELMKEQLYEKVEPLAGDYIHQNKILMQEAYHEQWTSLVTEMKVKIKGSADKHIDHYAEMLSKPVDLHIVKEKERVLQEILEWNKVQETEKNGK
ncbi:dynamin family protein [Virgibacillus oceani]